MSLLSFKDDRLVAAYSMNQSADHLMARKPISLQQVMDRNVARDPDIPLAEAVRKMSEVEVGANT